MNILAIIPARMGSSRFPGKPLADIGGMPMIERVYRGTFSASCLTDTVIATCDDEIRKCVASFGGKTIMTSKSHERASDRCSEAVDKYEEETGVGIDIVVMVQGDEPLITPELIDASVKPFFENNDVLVTNLCSPLFDSEDMLNPNIVKVVFDVNHEALYFSRSPIPFWHIPENSSAPLGHKQVCVIPFARDYLKAYGAMAPTAYEEIESIDMNRVLESGGKVKLVEIARHTIAVDTEADLQKVVSFLNG